MAIIDPSILNTSIELRQWGWLSGLGVIHTALVYALIYHALPNLKSSAIAVLTFIYPASAIFFDFVVNGKLLSPAQFLGLVIIVLSSLGITQRWKLPRFAAARVKLWSSATVTEVSQMSIAKPRYEKKETSNRQKFLHKRLAARKASSDLPSA